MMRLPICTCTLATTMCVFVGISSHTFDRAYTGVSFTPYVKTPPKGQYHNFHNYTRNEIQTMLKVILNKFSKIVTIGAGYNYGGSGTYKKNFTYYNESESKAWTSEVAANINSENNEKIITVLQGIWYHGEPRVETELNVAIEVAALANKIYKGTVEGLVMSHWDATNSYQIAQKAEKYQYFIRNSSVGHLRLGLWMYCDGLLTRMEENHKQILEHVLLKSDFVICKIDAEDSVKSNGPLEAFESASSSLVEFRKKLLNINDKLEVMGEVKWTSAGNKHWNNIKNLRLYWETAGDWAKQNSLPIWFFEAIDNPRRENVNPVSGLEALCGWWELSDNSKSNQMDGYIEKTETAEILLNTVSIVSITVGLLVITGLVVVIIFQHVRRKKLEHQIPKQDIRGFMEGVPDEVAMHNLSNFALKLPYDKSLELNKGLLKIDKNKILGIGHFGCVYNAEITSSTGLVRYVALKMTRHDCPRSALKSLLSEIKILMYIGKHTNIVALRGAYTEELQNGIIYIALELCSLGSPEGYLRKHANGNDPLKQKEITFYQMVKWSEEIACGMKYLGEKNVVHADLGTRNVLLTGDKTAKICDFGLSRRMYNYTNYVKTQQEPLPWRWMAIESLKRCEFSAKSEVWSYGVTLWEIFSMGDCPYYGLSWTTGFVNMLTKGLRLARPPYATPRLYKLMIDCWHNKANERPSFLIIHNLIKYIIAGNEETNNIFYYNAEKHNMMLP